MYKLQFFTFIDFQEGSTNQPPRDLRGTEAIGLQSIDYQLRHTSELAVNLVN